MFDEILNLLNESCDDSDKEPERGGISESCKKCNEDDDCGLLDTDVEDPDDDALVCEALILEAYGSGAGLENFLNEHSNRLVKEGLLNEKSIVRLDKYAKLSRAESQAVLILAKKNNDRDYKKLITLFKLKKVLKERLEKKYANAAKRYAKQMVKKGGKIIDPEK